MAVSKAAVEKAKNLRWIHTLTAGIDRLRTPAVLNLRIPVTNSKGLYSHSLAEFALLGCSYFAKNLSRLRQSQAKRKWDVFEVEDLMGRTMGIVGLGDIGFSTAKLAKAYKMNIIGLRRNPVLTEDEKTVVDAVYGSEDLVKFMGMCDYVVAALPLTPGTKDMITAEAINAMKPNGVFVNVGRGATVDEAALVEALRENRIKGAALDVFYKEPLKPENPLYDLDNVLLSSHTADYTANSLERAILFFKEILGDYVEGKELRNLVDLMEGY